MAGLAFRVAAGTIRTRQRVKLAKYLQSEIEPALRKNLAFVKAGGKFQKLEECAIKAGLTIEDVQMDSKDPWACPYKFNTWELPAEIADYASMPVKEKKPKKKRRDLKMEKSVAGSLISRMQTQRSKQR